MKKTFLFLVGLVLVGILFFYFIFKTPLNNTYKKIDVQFPIYPENKNIVYLNKGNFTADENGYLYYVTPIFNSEKNKEQLLVSKLNILSKNIDYIYLDTKTFETTENHGIILGSLTFDNNILYYKGSKGIWKIENNKVEFLPFLNKIEFDYANGGFVYFKNSFWIISKPIYRIGKKYGIYKYTKKNDVLISEKTIKIEDVPLNIIKNNDEVYIFCHDIYSEKYNLYQIKNDSLKKIYSIDGKRFNSSGWFKSNDSDKKYHWFSLKFISVLDNKMYILGILKDSNEYKLFEINLNTKKEKSYNILPPLNSTFPTTQYLLKRYNNKSYLFIKNQDDPPNSIKIYIKK
ncbi:hypothetical protein XO10_04430 [Marinitoga sp. 1135]|uniref:Uncharacterized protein n=1 Tax=Marinitoga piezophila (strain DSM 14283 / JCM 11233 / KA3) TaxID=443254 RepID=H2J7B7_MARPK|nr:MULTISPECIES: hypothetical protein [Marinitoga]AEX85309.1 hypothetical protein Marpi_0893 [Marinitoga piezophila KA3]APT75794.1 hypothetical protein LN42_04910 [Marinitoga sp. 1137]NUU95533.1 hypothetical protein [Marinitoga sp. 1135]NUU97460.1 hypothetical protein [Marinitoga sp. 1138]